MEHFAHNAMSSVRPLLRGFVAPETRIVSALLKRDSGSTIQASVMENAGFEAALAGRVDDMLAACTKCGACFSACPIAGPAGLGDADPAAVVSGVLDIVRLGDGPE